MPYSYSKILDPLIILCAVIIYWSLSHNRDICVILPITLLLIVIRINSGGIEGWTSNSEMIHNLSSLYNDKKVVLDTIEVKSAKIGDWYIRGDRMGIKDRGDLWLADDGWCRLVTPDGDKFAYNNAGFGGRDLFTTKGGIVDVTRLNAFLK